MNHLVDRFPSLRTLPHVRLQLLESPVVHPGDACGDGVWVKRDDLNTASLGGNKVRALEYLLAGAADTAGVLTVGGVGSTHVLATAFHAGTLGVPTRAFRWPHHLHEVGRRTSEAIEHHCVSAPVCSSPLTAFALALMRRVRHNEHWVPFGGTSARGLLGHVNGALELMSQVERGVLPAPEIVYCPLGTGGTAAGLALGLQIAGSGATVVAVRAGPRIGVEGARLRALVAGTRRLMEAHGARLPRASGPLRLRLDHSVYGGGYALPHPAATELAQEVSDPAWTLDATYSAKACLAAVRNARATGSPVLIWHTFDGRWLSHGLTHTPGFHDRMEQRNRSRIR